MNSFLQLFLGNVLSVPEDHRITDSPVFGVRAIIRLELGSWSEFRIRHVNLYTKMCNQTHQWPIILLIKVTMKHLSLLFAAKRLDSRGEVRR